MTQIMKKPLFFIFHFIFSVYFAVAQTGVLIPSSLKEKPDAQVLSLEVMNVEIFIDNQHADVKVMQIFDNHTPQNLEGKYLFALPADSSVFDFAVWDNDLRIPGVMMEKRRANKVYGEIKQTLTDPGLLQEDDEHSGNSAFSAKIFPINAFGTKRLEMEYTEDLAIENLTTHFTFPLKPAYGEAQSVGELNLRVHVLNDFEFAPISSDLNAFSLQVIKSEKNEFIGEYHAKNVVLNQDFSFDYQIKTDDHALSFIAYRAPEQISAYDLRDPKLANRNADGYFQAQAVFAPSQNLQKSPKRLILLLDTSLSMYGDKLSRSVEAVDFFLHNLTPDDEFNLILFNDEVNGFAPKPVAATSENVEKSMDLLRNSTIGGATNLKNGLREALAQSDLLSAGGEPQIILISDANPTLETTKTQSITALFENRQKLTKLFAFAVGSDANQLLLENLTAQTHGDFDQVRETEDISLKLKLFLEKIGTPSLENLRLESSDEKNFYDVYASGENSFVGANFAFVGRYKKAQAQKVSLLADFGANSLNLTKEINLPELDETHSQLPRIWARARVNALLQTMNRDGEREDYIAEIIRLSEKYKFVTPYTAFIAAPRALLRPRLIQPGDPVIRVKTDPSIKEVFAVLPFGETLPLKFLEAEGVWETRFLAPSWMADGTYRCRLLLTDSEGKGYQEEKTFVIDSRAPKVKINLDKQTFHAGDEISLKVSADSDTNRLFAKFYGAKPTQLLWSNAEKTNVGKLQIPANLSSGKYVLSVSAEDFAHNQTTEEISIEVIGQ